ncbi:MAG: hypothetical protein PWR06_2715 [Thermoanaerobacteraceae bacterium]|nr:hypothetical protein [Thermoanaerobacteraceae bacterium]MDN5301480.1 hypothetical protein [Thermoanaerobacteraceae bacterium]MDN5312105.1 hypothetical protein [Thermoanaerobacteraceae bacterium]
MNKKRLGIAAIILILLVATYYGFLREPSDFEESAARRIAKDCPRYIIDVDFDPDEKRIEGTQEVIIKNTEMVELTELYFHLYPNAFKTPDAAPFPKTEFASAYPDGFSPGYINIKKVTGVSGPLEYEVEDTILKVVLDKPLKPQQQIKLTLEFTEVIPPSYGRFGYGQNTYNIANWYPILAVYDENGWNKDPYYAVGDPFYSDVGLYEVKIKAPKEYTIAAGGSLSDKKQDGAYNIWTFKTGLVRDFAWVAGSKFQTASDMVDGVKITSFYMKEDAVYGKKALEYAKKAIKFYSEYFAKYPYKEYTVAASDFYIGGMEYPNLVMIGRQFYNDGDLLEYVVVHETAHQWWYGLVGNNEVKEPWLDEALTEYSTVLYYENVYGRKTGQRIYEDFIYNPYRFYEQSLGRLPGPVLRPLEEFSTWGEYDAIVYSRGAIMLKQLESSIGKEKFREALRFYFRQNIYKNATTADFIKAVNKATGADWTDYIYNKMLKNTQPLQKAA